MGNNPLMAECAELVKGVTILAASKESECSVECNGHGVFTSLLIGALKGGASDLLGNITPGYEVDEEEGEYGPRGKGLKKSTFEYRLEDGEDREIKKVYLNAEYKGSTATNYAGAYVGSGEGILANIYHGEDE